jgi:lipopolysaccharide biosynthesis glycosyltransferase
MPYNFCLWFYDRAEELFGGKLWYEPKIVHFAGAPKPWKLDSTANLKRGQAAFYEIWNEFRNRYPMEA